MKRPTALLSVLVLVALSVAAPGGRAQPAGVGVAAGGGGVKVTKGAPKVEYKEFDPNNLPKPPPPLPNGEAAVCVYGFEISSETRCTVAPLPRGANGAVNARITVTAVDVQLGLKVIVWLPKGVDDRLREHENTHRAIAEHYYADADKVARGIAEKWVGRAQAGKGKDLKAASKEALDVVNNRLCEEILKTLNVPCRRAQDVFDRLTDHGRNERPTAKDAMEKAIEEAGREKEKDEG